MNHSANTARASLARCENETGEQKVPGITGLTTGALSGLTYGIYTTLVLVAGDYEPLVSAVGILAAPYVCSGLNDLFAGIWLTIYNAKKGRLAEDRPHHQHLPRQDDGFGRAVGRSHCQRCLSGRSGAGRCLRHSHLRHLRPVRCPVRLDLPEAAAHQARGRRHDHLRERRDHHQLGQAGRQP